MSCAASSRSLLLVSALGIAAVACSAEHRERPPTDCSIEDSYDLKRTTTYNDPSKYYIAPNPGVPDPKVAFTSIGRPDPMDFTEICGHTDVDTLVFRTQGNHDWGSLTGTWPAPPPPPSEGVPVLQPEDMDAVGYEGISFWARSLYDRAHTLLLDDATSNAAVGKCIAQEDMATHITFLDEYGQPVPDACYLQFSTQIVPNPWWTFYTIPFTALTQGGNTPDPRLKVDGIDRSSISRIVIRAPRDAYVETWFSNIAWYKKK